MESILIFNYLREPDFRCTQHHSTTVQCDLINWITWFDFPFDFPFDLAYTTFNSHSRSNYLPNIVKWQHHLCIFTTTELSIYGHEHACLNVNFYFFKLLLSRSAALLLQWMLKMVSLLVLSPLPTPWWWLITLLLKLIIIEFARCLPISFFNSHS